MTTPEIIAKLAAAGVVVSAGHTNATYDQIRDRAAARPRGFTHLFNAMSQLTAREPGVVGAALEDPDSWCGIIVDGRHVDPVVLRLALRCKRLDRFMLVTDAMPSVGAAEKSSRCRAARSPSPDGVLVDEDGTLAGSDIDMAARCATRSSCSGSSLAEAARMASRYPAAFLGLGGELGRIAPGYRANLVLVDDGLEVTGPGSTAGRPHDRHALQLFLAPHDLGPRSGNRDCAGRRQEHRDRRRRHGRLDDAR